MFSTNLETKYLNIKISKQKIIVCYSENEIDSWPESNDNQLKFHELSEQQYTYYKKNCYRSSTITQEFLWQYIKGVNTNPNTKLHVKLYHCPADGDVVSRVSDKFSQSKFYENLDENVFFKYQFDETLNMSLVMDNDFMDDDTDWKCGKRKYKYKPMYETGKVTKQINKNNTSFKNRPKSSVNLKLTEDKMRQNKNETDKINNHYNMLKIKFNLNGNMANESNKRNIMQFNKGHSNTTLSSVKHTKNHNILTKINRYKGFLRNFRNNYESRRNWTSWSSNKWSTELAENKLVKINNIAALEKLVKKVGQYGTKDTCCCKCGFFVSSHKNSRLALIESYNEYGFDIVDKFHANGLVTSLNEASEKAKQFSPKAIDIF